MAHEANRFGAALKARDTGKAQITGPIVLVQDATRTPGFLFYAPFVFHKLVEGVLSKDKRQVRIQVRDGSEILYDEHSEADEAYDPDPLGRSEFSLDLYGRNWTFGRPKLFAKRAPTASPP